MVRTRSSAPPSVPARWALCEVTELDPRARQLIPDQRLPAGSVLVGAGSRWHNPFDAGADRNARAAAVGRYAVWLAGRADLVAAARAELGSRDLVCECPLDQFPCHRDVLLDVANPPATRFSAGGRAMGLTLRRPWASLMLVPGELGGKTVENRSWATDYRGPVLLYAGARVDAAGVAAAVAAGFDADWHAGQSGWLGAAALVDVHRARWGCCAPWGHPQRGDSGCFHWVFTGAVRLALPAWGRGFLGLRPVSWSVLVRRGALAHTGKQPQ